MVELAFKWNEFINFKSKIYEFGKFKILSYYLTQITVSYSVRMKSTQTISMEM